MGQNKNMDKNRAGGGVRVLYNFQLVVNIKLCAWDNYTASKATVILDIYIYIL